MCVSVCGCVCVCVLNVWDREKMGAKCMWEVRTGLGGSSVDGE